MTREEERDAGVCRTCWGFTVYNSTMRAASTPPRCWGIAQDRDGSIAVDATPQLDESRQSFKYMCIGKSISNSTGAGGEHIPACGGIKVLALRDIVDEAANAGGGSRSAAATAGSSAAGCAASEDLSDAAVGAAHDGGDNIAGGMNGWKSRDVALQRAEQF